MRREEANPDDKRFTLRMPLVLWRRLRMAAAKTDQSLTLLINDWLGRQADAFERENGKGGK
jgi:predicted HicB family RNase H-like nuclease